VRCASSALLNSLLAERMVEQVLTISRTLDEKAPSPAQCLRMGSCGDEGVGAKEMFGRAPKVKLIRKSTRNRVSIGGFCAPGAGCTGLSSASETRDVQILLSV